MFTLSLNFSSTSLINCSCTLLTLFQAIICAVFCYDFCIYPCCRCYCFSWPSPYATPCTSQGIVLDFNVFSIVLLKLRLRVSFREEAYFGDELIFGANCLRFQITICGKSLNILSSVCCCRIYFLLFLLFRFLL